MPHLQEAVWHFHVASSFEGLAQAGQRVASASTIIGYGREELFAFEQGQRGGARPRHGRPGPDSPQQQREPEGPEPQGDRSA